MYQIKKMQIESLKYVRDRFNLPFNDEQLEEVPFYRPSENSPELKYMKARREALGGYLPARRVKADETLVVPPLSSFQNITSRRQEAGTFDEMAKTVEDLLTPRHKAMLGIATRRPAYYFGD